MSVQRLPRDDAQPRLAREREQVEPWLRWAVFAGALLTLPLTLAHLRDWTPAWLVAVDWLIWSLFVVEFGFCVATAERRGAAARGQWLAALVILLSFPLWPYLLGLSRLLRLARVMRSVPLLKSVGATKAAQLGRLYLARSAGAQVVKPEAKKQVARRGPEAIRERINDTR
jgi:hypothetical protein